MKCQEHGYGYVGMSNNLTQPPKKGICQECWSIWILATVLSSPKKTNLIQEDIEAILDEYGDRVRKVVHKAWAPESFRRIYERKPRSPVSFWKKFTNWSEKRKEQISPIA